VEERYRGDLVADFVCVELEYSELMGGDELAIFIEALHILCWFEEVAVLHELYRELPKCAEIDSGRIDTSRLSGEHEHSGWIVYTALWCPLATSLDQSPTELNMVRPPTRS
jgi:hypothetical protein